MIANKIRIRFIKDDRVLQRMIRQLRGKPARIVHDGVPYGVIQEFGSATKAEGPVPKTPAYEILPKEKQALYWPELGHPISKVGPPVTRPHPGVTPTPFLTPAVEQHRITYMRGISSKRFLSRPDAVIEDIARKVLASALQRVPRDSEELAKSLKSSKPEDVPHITEHTIGIKL